MIFVFTAVSLFYFILFYSADRFNRLARQEQKVK